MAAYGAGLPPSKNENLCARSEGKFLIGAKLKMNGRSAAGVDAARTAGLETGAARALQR
jgi:hypothetical protein